MKLKKLTLENFRSFKGKHEIEFSPITLLFGGNSVGKSSMTKAIKNYDSLKKQDIYNGEKSVSVGLHFDEVEISDNYLRYDMPEMRLVEVLFNGKDPFAFFEQFAQSCHTSSIEKKHLIDPELRQTVYGVDGEWFLNIQDELNLGMSEEGIYEWRKSFVKFNLEHPILNNDSLKMSISSLNERFSELTSQDKGYMIHQLQCCWSKSITGTPIAQLANDLTHKNENVSYLMLDISRLVLVIRALEDTFKVGDVEHLGPLRKLPERVKGDFWEIDFIYEKREKERQYTGETAWESIVHSHWFKLDEFSIALGEDGPKLIDQVNDWLLNRFNTPYEIKFFENYSFEIDSAEKRERFDRGEISKADMSSSEAKVRFKNVQNGSITPASEIGVGISQLTPVIVHAINSKRFSVEQPELHIHPRMQTIVADLFVFEGLYQQAEKDQASVTIQTKNLDGSFTERSFVCKEEGKESFILVETHSEHLMLRLLKRVREEILKPEDLAIYYFENDNGQTKATKIGVDEEGEFTEAWPQGFFEERLEELF